MIAALSRLSSAEMELIYKSPLLVCILIAGADGNIDRKEIKKAIHFAQKKQQNSSSSLTSLFAEVAQDFEDKLKVLIQAYPYESTQRSPLIVEELSTLNQVWPKIPVVFAKEFYEMLLTLAKETATSSGGLLGYKSVGAEEAKFVKLSMINNPSLH